jgi:hypothetical protein
MTKLFDNREALAVSDHDPEEANAALTKEPLTNSPSASAALARKADAILRADNPKMSREDVTRRNYVHQKIGMRGLLSSDVPLDNSRIVKQAGADGGSRAQAHAGKVEFDDPADALDEKFALNALNVDLIEFQAISRSNAARTLFAEGDNAGAASAFSQARELMALAMSTRNHVCRNIALFGGQLTAALSRGDAKAAEALLVDAITADCSDYARKVACVRALAEIQALPPRVENPRQPFGATWLVDRCGLSPKAAQRLAKDAREIESGIAALLIGTEYGGRAELQRLWPKRLRIVARPQS